MILFGADFVEDHAVVSGNCNGNSPLVWDATMPGAMRAFARRNQPVLDSTIVRIVSDSGPVGWGEICPGAPARCFGSSSSNRQIVKKKERADDFSPAR